MKTKTPKPSTPAVKSKINTPRSGFIKKNAESGKKVKLNSFQNDLTKSGNITPKMCEEALKKFGKFSSNKRKNGTPPTTIVTPTIKGNKKKSSLSELQFSPNKGIKKGFTPKGKNQTSPGKNLTPNNKRSPEVQLGLDIEQYLDKNSANGSPTKTTPKGKKKKNKINSPAKVTGGNVLIDSTTQNTEDNVLKQNSPLAIANQNGKKKKPNKKGKKSPVSKESKKENVVKIQKIKNAVTALMKYVSKTPKEKDELLGSIIQFNMQINYIQVPKAPKRRVLLPHSIWPENVDICLFVADKGKSNQDPEELVENVQECLKRNDVTCITEILPWKKALHDHTQHEQKIKLKNRFDLFLIENKLSKIKAGLTSKFTPQKFPIPVSLEPEKKLKGNINRALKKVAFSFRNNGLTKFVRFGHYKMPVNELVDNINAILTECCNEKLYPGERDNIRSIFIKTNRSSSFPLYITTKSSNTVNPSPQEGEEKDEGVEGELSTLIDRKVTVFKDGRVKTNKIKNVEKKIAGNNQKKQIVKQQTKEWEEEDEDEMEEDEEEVSEDESMEVDIMENKKTKKEISDDSSSDDEQIGEAEQNFLQQLRLQQDEIESQKNAKKVKSIIKGTPNQVPAKSAKNKKTKQNFSGQQNKNRLNNQSKGKKPMVQSKSPIQKNKNKNKKLKNNAALKKK